MARSKFDLKESDELIKSQELKVSRRGLAFSVLVNPPFGQSEMEPNKLIVHYADGRVLKGHSEDFSPNNPQFDLFQATAEATSKPTKVLVKELKGVYFVRDFEGIPSTKSGKRLLRTSELLGGRWR
jgi:hypothetical protein